jgi:hypothetical protein
MALSLARTSPSHTYLKMWKDLRIDYLERLDVGSRMRESPKLVDRIVRVEAAMKTRGLVPFVHAMPAGAKVPMQFYGEQQRFFKHLRPKSLPFMLDYEEARSAIPQTQERTQKLHLLSVSYALTSGVLSHESAASWGFVNHFGNHQNEMLQAQFRKVIEESNQQHKSYFLERGNVLIRKFGRLSVGDFLVIGVPKNKLSRWFYDSKPYNVPSGRDIASVVEDPRRYKKELAKEGTHMATMIICKETLSSDSGLMIVRANDSDEVKSFTKERVCKLGFKRPKVGTLEKEESQTRAVLDRELDRLCQEFSGKLQFTPRKLTDEEIDFRPSDVPHVPF